MGDGAARSAHARDLAPSFSASTMPLSTCIRNVPRRPDFPAGPAQPPPPRSKSRSTAGEQPLRRGDVR